jgi:superfamily II DNA helicase RecQ
MDMKILVTSQADFDRPLRLEVFGLCLELSGITKDSTFAVSEGEGGVTVSFSGSKEIGQPITDMQQTTGGSETTGSSETADGSETTDGSESTDGSETTGGSESIDGSETTDGGVTTGGSETTGGGVTTGGSESTDDSEDRQKRLFQGLAALRKKIASDAGLPPYIIFHDSTLKDMCRLLPSDLEALKDVSGVGKAKLEKYGELFIEAIREYSKTA